MRGAKERARRQVWTTGMMILASDRDPGVVVGRYTGAE